MCISITPLADQHRRAGAGPNVWRACCWSLGLHLAAVFVAAACRIDAGTSPRPSARDTLRVAASIHPVGSTENQLAVIQFVSARSDAGLADLIRHEVVRRQCTAADEQMIELRIMAERLQRVSDRRSIQAMSRCINSVFPTETRPAADDSAFDFDFDTAQIVDIRRDSSDQYMAVLEDCHGRRREAPIDAQAGRFVQQVLQLIREYPLLETVYDDIVRNLLNSLDERTY